MIEVIKSMGINNKKVLNAMKRIPRHLFIPLNYRQNCDAYGNHPCPIGYGQTISQPYIVAFMTSAIFTRKNDKILEIGTGSGYQAAVLCELKLKVFSIEIIPGLYNHAKKVLSSRGYKNLMIKRGDGYKGWAKHGPYDAIIVTCAPKKVPPALIKQLKNGGRMIIPLGTYRQKLVILQKRGKKLIKQNVMNVRFVPMVQEK